MSKFVQDFKSRCESLWPGVFKRSLLNIRDGGRIIEDILVQGQYDTILEIGTFRGASAAFMSQFCKRVITIDLRNGELEAMDEPFDREMFWRSLGIKNIDLRLVSNDHEKYSLIGGLGFDFAFIDGDHMSPAPANEFNAVRSCGEVLFHDYDGINQVSQFVDTLPKTQVRVTDIFAMWKESWQ